MKNERVVRKLHEICLRYLNQTPEFPIEYITFLRGVVYWLAENIACVDKENE